MSHASLDKLQFAYVIVSTLCGARNCSEVHVLFENLIVTDHYMRFLFGKRCTDWNVIVMDVNRENITIRSI
jgi:3'-phosphoadenosine 5'-phosphosulfate sulfotransferase